MKERDKLKAQNGKSVCAAVFDLQKVLQTPYSDVTSSIT